MKVGDHVDIMQTTGVCVFCEKVIFLPGVCAVGVRAAVLRHIKTCSQHPLHGFNARKYEDDVRGADEGTADYKPGERT